MSSRSPRAAVLVLLLAGLAALAAKGIAAPARELRVCADPNNLPFSSQRGEGFENALAELLAREMGATVRYTWWAQRRGFIRNTLRAGECDVVPGVPSSFELALPTRPRPRPRGGAITWRRGPRSRRRSPRSR